MQQLITTYEDRLHGEENLRANPLSQFLAHDGITNYYELVDAQQNLYNVGYDLAVSLATMGVALDGDILTGKLSIGCDATSRTSGTGGLLGRQSGLNGHNVSSSLEFTEDTIAHSLAEIRRGHIADTQRLLPG
jgi:hypothetical protein